MKKQNYILALMALLAGTAYGAPRSLEQARLVAQRVFAEKLHVSGTITPAMQMPQMARAFGDKMPLVPYYAFNDARSGSFVLVSGSDLMPEVLGYSHEGTFPASVDQLPPNMRDWLQYVSEVELYLEEHPEAAAKMEHQVGATTPVAPMLTTEWGQDAPYSDQCPLTNTTGEKSVTGCVATSVSQVLNYHRFPTELHGKYEYYDRGKLRKVNFTGVTINYDLLLDKYTRGAGTEEERAEVAKLMNYVGYAMTMQYGTDAEGGSGATSALMDHGAIEYLDCTKTQTLYRVYYSLSEWDDIMQTEIYNGRPVIFGGQSSTGGHSFVLDGLDDKGLYHVNWGWDGFYQGYFDISVMHPESVGVGASSSADGFAGNQHATINFCPPEKAGRWHSQILVNNGGISVSTSSTTVGGRITLKANAYNDSYNIFNGYMGAVLMQGDVEVDRKMNDTQFTIDASRMYSRETGGYAYYSYGDRTLVLPYDLPADLPDGTYRLYMCVQPDGCDDYDYVRCTHHRQSYRTLEVTNGNVKVLSDAVDQMVTVAGWNFEQKEMKTAPETVVAYIENTGTEAKAYTYSLRLTRPNGTRLKDVAGTVVSLNPGEKDSVAFEVQFNAVGSWKAELRGADVSMGEADISLGSGKFDVVLDPTQGADFTVSKRPEAVGGKAYNVGDVTLTFSVQNAGAAYDGKMAVRLYSNKSKIDSRYLLAEVEGDVQVDASATKEVELQGTLNIEKMAGDQAVVYARVFYLRGYDMVQIGSSATNFTIYKVGEEVGIGEVHADELQDKAVFDLQGRRVMNRGQLKEGIYLIDGKKKLVR